MLRAFTLNSTSPLYLKRRTGYIVYQSSQEEMQIELHVVFTSSIFSFLTLLYVLVFLSLRQFLIHSTIVSSVMKIFFLFPFCSHFYIETQSWSFGLSFSAIKLA